MQDNTLDDLAFHALVFDYLLAFEDLHILWRYRGPKPRSLGFKTRRWQDSLHVVKKTHPKGLDVGTEITHIDGLDIPAYATKYAKRLRFNAPERQRFDDALLFAEAITIKHDDRDETITLPRFEATTTPSNYQITHVEDKILYLILSDFNNPDALIDLIEPYRPLLEDTPGWIIDVRDNNGGSDAAYQPFLPYFFNNGETLESDEVYHLMSERNCKLRKGLIRRYMDMSANKPETRQMLEKFINDIDRFCGKGFVKTEPRDVRLFRHTYPNPRHVVILTDVECASSGEQFVIDARQAAKVKVFGRPTLGVLDYSNLARINFDDVFDLWYPTSKVSTVKDGVFSKDGLVPDHYIPWTPRHLYEDEDIKQAVRYLKKVI
ncbi:MAG: hypothetical protein EA375_00085 [Acholeplasmataceae bacterium]|nr:MAG: hypothetical protein EA375_00085 [Acholeplasmataceae bacterium]